MCENSVMLIFLLILKIIFLIIVPVFIFFIYQRIDSRITNKIYSISLIVILLFILLRILNVSCISNSTIKGIKINGYKESTGIMKEPVDVSDISKVDPIDKISIDSKTNIFYYNNNSYPLNKKRIKCDGKDLYFRNIGNNITAVSMLLSSTLNRAIDPIELLNLSIDNEILDCEKGVNTGDLFYLISEKYNVTVREVSREDAIFLVNTGKIVLINIDNNLSDNNISCENSNIILYRINNEGKYNILNPDDRNYDYICPDNSEGYSSVIKANSNDKEWDALDLFSLTKKFFIIER